MHMKIRYIFTLLQVMGVLVYYLVVYPEVQSRLQEEIDDLFDGKDEGEDLTQDDITGMVYLDQVTSLLHQLYLTLPSIRF